MFIEIVDPKIIDDMSTRDRVKVRIAEPGISGRFWVSLVFYKREDLKRFAEELLKASTGDLLPKT
jgi:hypothetical protein